MPPNSQTFLRQKTVFVPNKTATEVVETADLNNNNILPNKRQQQQIVPQEDEEAKLKSSLKHQQHSKSCRVRYLIQLNIVSSKSGRIYLNKDLRIFISKKVDLETAERIAQQSYELKSFNEMPENPKYFAL